MKKEKFLLSIALSGIIAGTFLAGCNDNDNVKVPNTRQTVTAVDDYVYNGQLYAVVYDKETKSIKKIPGTTDVAYLDKKTNKIHKGSENYIKPLIRPDQVLLYYKFEKPNSLSSLNKICADTNNYECYPTFVDVNNNGKYDTNTDETFNTDFYVTKVNNSSKVSVVTPVTTLSLDVIKEENNSATLDSAIQNYLNNNNGDVKGLQNYLYNTNVAVLGTFVRKLGYKINSTNQDTISNIISKIIMMDPLKTAPKEEKYNSLINNIVALVDKNSLSTKFYNQLKKLNDINTSQNIDTTIIDGLKNIQTVINNIGDVSLSNAKNIVDKILSYENNGNPVDVLLSINPALSVKDGVLKTDKISIAPSDLLIKGIGFNSGNTVVKDFHSIYENGYKLDSGNDLKLTLNWFTNGKDANISFNNKKLDFVLDFQGIGNTEKNSTTSKSEFQLIIPTYVTASNNNGTIDYRGKINPNDKTTVNVEFSDGTATTMNMNMGDILGTDINSTFDGKSIDISKIIKGVINKANTDYNQTLPNPITKISDMKVYLKGTNIKNVITNSQGNIVGDVSYKTTNVTVPGTKGLITDLVPFINENSVYADWRGNRTGSNEQPMYNDIKINYPAGVEIRDFYTSQVIPSDSNITGKTIIYNVNTTIPDQEVKFIFNKTDKDTWETNTKFDLSSNFDPNAKNKVISSIITKSLEVNQTNPATVLVSLDNNYSVNDYNISYKHPKYTLSYNITDEFGKTGDVATTIYMNREPLFLPIVDNNQNTTFGYYYLDNNGTSSTLSSYDVNGNLIASSTTNDGTVSEPVFLGYDIDGLADVDMNNLQYKIGGVDVNTTYSYNITDINLSDNSTTNLGTNDKFVLFKDYAKQITIKDGEGNTTDIKINPTCVQNGGCSFKVSGKTNTGKWSSDTSVIVNIQPEDKYKSIGSGGFLFVIKAAK